MKEWTVRDAAAAWGLQPRQASNLMPRVPGHHIEIIRGRTTHLIPAGSNRPPMEKPGVKPGTTTQRRSSTTDDLNLINNLYVHKTKSPE